MDFELTEEQRLFQNMVREFAENEVRPGAMERDEKAEFPFDLCRKAGELGLMGILVPEEFGGAGLDVTSFAIATEEISRQDGSFGLTIASHNGLCVGHLVIAGSDHLKKNDERGNGWTRMYTIS